VFIVRLREQLSVDNWQWARRFWQGLNRLIIIFFAQIPHWGNYGEQARLKNIGSRRKDNFVVVWFCGVLAQMRPTLSRVPNPWRSKKPDSDELAISSQHGFSTKILTSRWGVAVESAEPSPTLSFISNYAIADDATKPNASIKTKIFKENVHVLDNITNFPPFKSN